MKTPYQHLEVDEQATDREIKQAYLQKLKLSPPDRDPDKFQQLHDAYETIKNVSNREKYALFSNPEADFDALLDQAFITGQQPSLLTAGQFSKLLLASMDETTFQLSKPSKTLV